MRNVRGNGSLCSPSLADGYKLHGGYVVRPKRVPQPYVAIQEKALYSLHPKHSPRRSRSQHAHQKKSDTQIKHRVTEIEDLRWQKRDGVRGSCFHSVGWMRGIRAVPHLCLYGGNECLRLVGHDVHIQVHLRILLSILLQLHLNIKP